MSDTKRICTRIINKHAPTTTWDSADCTFVPEVGELIIYEPSEAGAPARIKIGDGSTYENGKKKAVKDLPFVVQDYSGDISELNKALSDHEKNSTAHITSAERIAWNGKAAGTHTHDDRYYTEKEVNDLLAGKSDTHNHPYAPTAHTHVTRDITALTGYTKASAAAEIAATDSLNVALGKIQKTLDTKANSVLSGYTKASSVTAIATTDTVLTAIGKLEKALDGKSATHNHPYSPTGHPHNSSEVTKMTSYAKATAASAIATTDSLNTAIGKLEKGLDERAPRVLTGYSKATTVSALATSDTIIAALGKLEKALDGKSATHNHPYSSNSHEHGNITNAGALATANAVVVTDGNKKVVASTSITTTELGYLDGVTSNIQTQLNGKAATHNHPYVKTDGTSKMTGKLDMEMSNPHIHMKDTGYTTNWYFQAYQDQLAFGPTFDSAVKTDKSGNMTVPGTVTVENKVKLDYDSTSECLNFVFV